jgi:hypothetical protein
VNLADHIRAQRGTAFDHGEALSALTHGIDGAQRFVIGDDIMSACYALMDTKPSTMLSALPMCRLPYPKMWVEYRGGLGPANVRDVPVPSLQGFMIESFGGTDDRTGSATVAWMHPKHSVTETAACFLTPFAIYFDWRPDGDVRNLVRGLHRGLIQHAEKVSPDVGQMLRVFVEGFEAMHFADTPKAEWSRFMMHRHGWQKFADQPREIAALQESERHILFGVSAYGVRMLLEVYAEGMRANNPDGLRKILSSWLGDVQGEGMILETLLVMLNSKNVVQHAAVDLSRLNKARNKRGKAPLLDYTKTTIALSRARLRAAAASGLSHEAARAHMVRGHFKIRRTGVFWWSPFVRGDRSHGEVKRLEYDVT